MLGGVASLAAGFVTRADLRASVESGDLAPADATGKATMVNALLGAGYAGVALGVGLGGGVVLLVSDTPGVGWATRW